MGKIIGKRQILFLAESRFQKIRGYILDIIGIGIIIYCGFNFLENPILISIIICFIVFMLLLPGHNMVIVYSDGIEFRVKHKAIGKLSRHWYFHFNDIESLDVNLQLTEQGFIISELIGSGILSLSLWNTINVKLKNGKEKIINTKVYKDDIVKALNIVKHVSKNKVIITGL
jgi:hypothetical protein